MAEPFAPGPARRLAFVDALKALASQLIVLHHLAFYGPLSDQAYALLPALISGLSQHARLAVQAFLVIGGFLAAQGLAPAGSLLTTRPLRLLWQRYLKLVAPYLAAVLLAIGCAAVARGLMTHDSLPGPPTLPQVVAHALLLQSILGYEGLSAGVWYVAIDFQLYLLLVGILWLARRLARDAVRAVLGSLLVAALALASLYHFNRQPDWDSWGVYFFASYALGALVYWVSNRPAAAGWLLLIVVAVIAALLLDYRSRIALALAVALALALARRTGFIESWPAWHWIARLGKISYSVFLVHFPVCLVISGLFARFATPDPTVSLIGMLVAWLASLMAGALFHRFIESRLPSILRRFGPTFAFSGKT